MKGICFKEEMFDAVISGRKTKTRRVATSENPKYKKGETLFLKEPYAIEIDFGDIDTPNKKGIVYQYDNGCFDDLKFKNKLFMPEKYARFFIKILEVSREKLQSITDRDAIAEGIAEGKIEGEGYFYINYQTNEPEFGIPKDSFESLWNLIHTKEHTWAENPEVFVYEFKLVK